MRKGKDPTLDERLAPEEVAALRRRLAEDGGGLPDVRAHGAATVDDVAEAVGVPPEEVRQGLDRVRADHAWPGRPARRGQRGLLVLALALLAAAYPIHLLNPRKLTTEEEESQAEERLTEYQGRRKAHPVVHYPILTRVRSGPFPPAGFPIVFEGELTETTSVPDPVASGPQTRETVRAALIASILHAYAVAAEAERDAPKPDHPLPPEKRYFGDAQAKPGPGTLAYSFEKNGYNRHPLAIPPLGVAADAWNEEARRTIGPVVDGMLDGIARSQAESLKVEPPRWGNFVTPPSGYSVSFAGQQSSSYGSTESILLPYDADRVARKLEWTVRWAMWHDADPPDFSTPESRIALEKKPLPADAEVRIHGPRGEVAFRLPMTASSEYPNAAAAARAADRILNEAVRKAASQVGPLGPREETR